MANTQFEYDPERLIEEVRKRPGIWDSQDIEYRNKRTRHKLWREIITELIQTNTIKVSKSEMRELEIQLQKKWKGIRDCYQKYVTKRTTTMRPYIYSKQLEFLRKFHEVARGKEDDDTTSGSDEEVKPKEIPKPKINNIRKYPAKKKMIIVKDEEMSSGDETFNFTETLDGSVDNSIDDDETMPSSTGKINQNQVDEFAFANVDAQTKSDVEDPDKMFLLSLLPHLKAIPEESQLNVKMELMQVLRNANYNTMRQYKMV